MKPQPQLFPTQPLFYSADFMTADEQESLAKNANDQEIRVLNFLECRADRSFGASKIWVAIKRHNEPLTSIRRALYNLAKQGKVEKLDETRKGLYGKKEHVWRIL